MAYTIKTRKAIPLKFVLVLIFAFIVGMIVTIAYFVPAVAELFLSGIAFVWLNITSFANWLLVPQVFLSSAIILLVVIMITQRGYLFKKKVTVLPQTQPLQSQLQQPSLQPQPQPTPTVVQPIIEEVKKEETQTTS